MSHGLVTDTPVTRDELLARAHGTAHVVGTASAEGVATARLLTRLGFSVVLHDMRPRPELRKAFRTTHGAFSRTEQDELWDGEIRPLLEAGRFGDEYLTGIGTPSADAPVTVVLGQGWYLDAGNRTRVAAAIPQGALVTSMTALYLALVPGPIAAVTGTNGKSTTVALAEHLLAVAGVPFACAGNERSSRQFLPDLATPPADPAAAAGTWALLEISNRQLLQAFRSPDVAAITALTPDHLEEHGGIAGYTDAKSRLFRWQDPATGIAIANADDPAALAAAESSPAAPARLVRCGIAPAPAPSVLWEEDGLVARDLPVHDGATLAGRTVLATRADVTMPGDHNLRNAAVACALALACGAAPASIAPALRTFAGKSLRLEQLDTIGGVEVWSDLKATTPEATIAALTALSPRHVELIAGGDDKGLDYAPLAAAIVAAGAGVHLVPGTATDLLERELDLAGAPAPARVNTLPEALEAAFARARSGDAVIVSPAAAGFWTTQLQGGRSLRALVREHAGAVAAAAPGAGG